MPHFVALLRGVNVGKGNRVPMAEFKAMLERLGYTSVKTVLNSGNAVFAGTGRSPKQHAASIASALQQTMGVTAPVIVKSRAELSAVIGASPLNPPDAEHSRYLVVFAAEEESLQALAPLKVLAQAPERFFVTQVAAFLHCPAGLLESGVGKALLGKTGQHFTTRNWATVLKLFAQAGSSDAQTRAPVADTRLFRLDGGIRRNADVERWLFAQPAELQKIARFWLEALRNAGQDVVELLHDGHPTACVQNLAFGYVNAFREHVNVGFFLGSSLEDPKGMLHGTGRFMRHVKLRPAEPQDEEALRQLIGAAYRDMKARLQAP